MKLFSRIIYILIFLLLFSCTKKNEKISVLKETNLETQMVELYNQGM